MLAAFKGIHTSVVAAALCFCCPLPLLPPASALYCCCPLPLLATAAAACHCSLSRARRRPCRSSPARASSPTRVPPPRPCAATTAPPGRPASLPSPFLLPPLALLLVSLSHTNSLFLCYLQEADAELQAAAAWRFSAAGALLLLAHVTGVHPRRIRFRRDSLRLRRLAKSVC